MSDAEDAPKNDKNENGQQVPANFAGILKQVQGEIKKSKNGPVKQEVQKLLTKKEEHERAIRQIDAQIVELQQKFEAGVL